MGILEIVFNSRKFDLNDDVLMGFDNYFDKKSKDYNSFCLDEEDINPLQNFVAQIKSADSDSVIYVSTYGYEITNSKGEKSTYADALWIDTVLPISQIERYIEKSGVAEPSNISFVGDSDECGNYKVSVPEQGGGKLIPEGMCNPGQVYTVAQGKTGMLGVFRLESQMMPGNGKFERSGLGSDGKCKEATNTAFNFLKANSNRISGSISTTTKDYIINYQDLQGIGMTDKLALPTLIALSSVALGKPVASSLAVLGEISIAGTLIKVDELANSLQVCLDSGAKKVLLPIVSAADIGAVPSDLIGCFNLIFYSSAEDAVYKALGVE